MAPTLDLSHPDKLKIWNKITRIAFAPEKQGLWLRNYTGFLGFFHQNGHTITFTDQRMEKECDLGGIIKLKIAVGDCYSIQISKDLYTYFEEKDDNVTETIIKRCDSFDFDNRYCSYFDHSIQIENPSDAIFTEENIRKTINDFIAHPASHIHIKDVHEDEFRITTETKNPFVFLYQIAFQLLEPGERCDLDKEEGKRNRKEIEITRISKVIYDNRDKDRIGPGLLFKT